MESPFFLASGVPSVTNAFILRRVTFVPKHRFYKMPIDSRYSSHTRTNEHRFWRCVKLKILYLSFFFDIVDEDSGVAIETFSFVAIKRSFSCPFAKKEGKKKEYFLPRILASCSLSESERTHRNSLVLLYSYIYIYMHPRYNNSSTPQTLFDFAADP